MGAFRTLMEISIYVFYPFSRSKIWKISNRFHSYYVWCLKTFMTTGELFQTFLICTLENFYWIFERFTKKLSNSVHFELRKCSFFQMDLNFIRNWLVPLSVCGPPLTCNVPHQTLIKTSTRLSVTSEPSVPPTPKLYDDP